MNKRIKITDLERNFKILKCKEKQRIKERCFVSTKKECVLGTYNPCIYIHWNLLSKNSWSFDELELEVELLLRVSVEAVRLVQSLVL